MGVTATSELGPLHQASEQERRFESMSPTGWRAAFQRLNIFRASPSIGDGSAGGLLAVESHADPAEVFSEDLVIVYKHSTRCPTSLMAMGQVLAFAREYDDTTVYGINVIEQRLLSNRTAEYLDVPHASPQLFVIRKGEVTGCLTHHAIRANAIEDLLDV